MLARYDMSLGMGLGRLNGRVFRIGHLGFFNDLTLCGTLCGVEMGLVACSVPHREGGLLQRVRERGKLRSADYEEAGIHIKADVPADLAAELAASARVKRA